MLRRFACQGPKITAVTFVAVILIIACVHSPGAPWPASAVGQTKSGLLTRRADFGLLSSSAKGYSQTLPFENVVVVVTSVAHWTERRQRIRTQFPRNVKLIKEPSQSVVLRFAIGTQNLTAEFADVVDKEQQRHSDILLLDCPDMDQELTDAAYWNLDAGPSATTSKVLLSIRWAVHNFQFEYFFRLGDDSYLRIDVFTAMLAERFFPSRNAVVGRINTAEVYGLTQNYASGAGYALTFDVCTFIASNTNSLSRTAPEDCVVARWLFALGAKFVDSPLWREMGAQERCDPDMLLAHRLPADAWSRIADDGTVEC